MKYPIVVADPPWQFDDELPGTSRGASRNYAVLGVGAAGEPEDFGPDGAGGPDLAHLTRPAPARPRSDRGMQKRIRGP